MMILSERFETALKAAKGKTKAGLAAACQVSRPSVSDWFSGETVSLKAVPLIKAAKYLGVEPLWLATGEGPRTSTSYATNQIASPLFAREPASEYRLNWPLPGVSKEEFFNLLSEEDRRDVATFALGLLAAAKRRTSGKHA